MLHRIAGARVDNVLVSPAFEFEITLVIAGSNDSFTIAYVKPGYRIVGHRRLYSNFRLTAVNVTEHCEVPANIYDGVFDTAVTQQINGESENCSLRYSAEVDLRLP